ncbi:hypothetical protein GPECTOR_1g539 [Gonium pectorale]|uniref:RING-type domain-containing protein n=1 Tax=Gonium pectorale TaxID=33097 RepID=A0A150H356_GONPE|nr:hypothetical protein GPECTOR_1g539 [Gonium pectorale]|eukprot:KXZ56599.1 hypothetical protein GPECTOR_1g539 [Gonium pectorale]
MAACPLGFGGPGAGAELTPYHCQLCRGLLHEPVETDGCRHVFCAFCIRRFRDCPTCGADINSTKPKEDLAGSIRKLLLGHVKLLSRSVCPAAARPSPPSGAAACPVAPLAGPAAPLSPASALSGVAGGGAAPDLPSLLLQLALESLAGGNPEAAIARLEMCADALCSSAEAAAGTRDAGAGASASAAPDAASVVGASTAAQPAGNRRAGDVAPAAVTSARACSLPLTADAVDADAAGAGAGADADLSRRLAAARCDPDTASRLGAVLGSQGDCHRRLGDAAAAHRLYAASAACLAPWRGRSREADSALGVTHNKLGDLLLMAGRLAEAREQYEQALEIRRGAVAAAAARGGAGGQVGGAGRGGAAGVGAAEAEAEALEEATQDACDLATSLCKVADVRLAMQEEEQTAAAGAGAERPPQEQQDGQDQAAAERRGQGEPEGGPATGLAAADHRRQGAGQGPAPVGAAHEVGQLLQEARQALLRPEVAPFARACGLVADAEGDAGMEAGSEGQQGSAAPGSGAGPAKERADAEGAAAGGLAVGESARAGVAKGGEGGAGAAGLPKPLLQRYGRVWGAVEQLSARLQEMQVAAP